MIFGPCQETSYTAITLNPESNCTCREKNHFLFHWSTSTLPEQDILHWMCGRRKYWWFLERGWRKRIIRCIDRLHKTYWTKGHGTVPNTIPEALPKWCSRVEPLWSLQGMRSTCRGAGCVEPWTSLWNHFDDGFQSSCVRQIEWRNTRERWRSSVWENQFVWKELNCTSEFVSRYTGYKPNNVWSGLKHSRRALTEIRDVVGTFFVSFKAVAVVEHGVQKSGACRSYEVLDQHNLYVCARAPHLTACSECHATWVAFSVDKTVHVLHGSRWASYLWWVGAMKTMSVATPGHRAVVIRTPQCRATARTPWCLISLIDVSDNNSQETDDLKTWQCMARNVEAYVWCIKT